MLHFGGVGIAILEFTISSQGRGCHKKPYVVPIGSMFGTLTVTFTIYHTNQRKLVNNDKYSIHECYGNVW